MTMQMTLSDVWNDLDTGAKRSVKRINVYPDGLDGTVTADCLAEDERILLTRKLADGWDDDTGAQLAQQSVDLAALLPTALTSHWVTENNLVIEVDQRAIPEG